MKTNFKRTKTYSGLKSSQSEFELSSMVEFFKKHDVRKYLEIGARHGDTFVYVMQALDDHKYLLGIAVDLPGGLWGKSSSQEYLKKAVYELNKENIHVACFLGSSQDEAIINKIIRCGPYDAILIDGDHTYQGVSIDFENFKDFAPIICFHDIVGYNEKERVYGNAVEVPKFWAELKEGYKDQYEFFEFVDDGSTMGIGVMVKKGES